MMRLGTNLGNRLCTNLTFNTPYAIFCKDYINVLQQFIFNINAKIVYCFLGRIPPFGGVGAEPCFTCIGFAAIVGRDADVPGVSLGTIFDADGCTLGFSCNLDC
jgi:hypothetical protein